MHSAGGPDMLVGQLAPATRKAKAKQQLSFESSPPKGSVVRQLSFASADTSSPDKLSEKDSLVKKASFESAPLSQSPEKQIVPGSPQQDAEDSTQQGAASSSQPSAPAAKPALPQPGSTLSLESQGRRETGSPMRQGSSCTMSMLLRMRRLLAQWAKAS